MKSDFFGDLLDCLKDDESKTFVSEAPVTFSLEKRIVEGEKTVCAIPMYSPEFNALIILTYNQKVDEMNELWRQMSRSMGFEPKQDINALEAFNNHQNHDISFAEKNISAYTDMVVQLKKWLGNIYETIPEDDLADELKKSIEQFYSGRTAYETAYSDLRRFERNHKKLRSMLQKREKNKDKDAITALMTEVRDYLRPLVGSESVLREYLIVKLGRIYSGVSSTHDQYCGKPGEHNKLGNLPASSQQNLLRTTAYSAKR